MSEGSNPHSLDFWLELVARYSGLLLAFSLVVLVLAAVLLPVVIARMPADYFYQAQRRKRSGPSRQLLPALLLAACKNLLGAALVVAGLVMLLTPGQGLLTLLAGLMLMNYPGKYAFERWLVRQPGVLRGLNWVRRRSGQAPLQAPPDADA